MKRFVPAVCLLALVGVGSVHGQDAPTVDAKHCRVIADNAYVRVLEFTLPPGEKDPVHSHAAGVYVVTSAGKMKVSPVGAKLETWEPKMGEAAWMEAEGPHASENVGATPISFVLVEVKAAAGKASRRN